MPSIQLTLATKPHKNLIVRDGVNGESYELLLDPPLDTTKLNEKRPRVYLHNFTGTNSFANVHKQLYDNADVQIILNIGGNSLIKVFTVPDGAWSLSELERYINQQLFKDVFVPNKYGTDSTVTGDAADTGDRAFFYALVNNIGSTLENDGSSTTALNYLANPYVMDTDRAFAWPNATSLSNGVLNLWAVDGTVDTNNRFAGYAGGTPHFKLLSIEPDFTANRVVIQAAAALSFTGTLVEKLLGFSNYIGPITMEPITSSGTTRPIHADKAADFDSARSVSFHCPTLAATGYDAAGKGGGSILSNVPINVDIGSVVSWEASIPVYVPMSNVNTRINSLEFFITNEENNPVTMLGDTFEAVVVIDYDD